MYLEFAPATAPPNALSKHYLLTLTSIAPARGGFYCENSLTKSRNHFWVGRIGRPTAQNEVRAGC